MREGLDPDVPLWVQDPDADGGPIQEELLDAARRNWKRALHYARRQNQDASRAAEIFEAVVRSVSRAMRRHADRGKHIRNLDAYLFWAFARRLARIAARHPRIEFVGSLEDLASVRNHPGCKVSPDVEDEVFIKELIAHLSEPARQMFFLRISGYSWKEIAEGMGISANNAQVQFNYAVSKARRRILGLRRSSGASGKGDDRDV